MSKLCLEKKKIFWRVGWPRGTFSKKVFPTYTNQSMDSRFEIKSIKKSQIHTHMLGLPQKLTKLEIALKTSIALDLGLVPKNWPWNELLFTLFTTKAPPGGHWWNRVFTQILHTKSWHTFKEKSLRISLIFQTNILKKTKFWHLEKNSSHQFYLRKKWVAMILIRISCKCSKWTRL